jgi:hypothetical protein
MKIRIFGAIFALAIAGIASANVQFTGVANGINASIKFNGNNKSVFAGRLNFKETTTNTLFKTVCGDLGNTISGGQQWAWNGQSTASMPAPYQKAGQIVSTFFGTALTNNEGAALQLAVWEAIYDNGFDLSSGNFQYNDNNATVSALALTFYNGGLSGSALYLAPQPSNAGQGQLTVNPVPEPGTMAALGLGALAFIRRRRK